MIICVFINATLFGREMGGLFTEKAAKKVPAVSSVKVKTKKQETAATR